MEDNERLVLYQIATQDIRDLKANQWRFSHYGILIQAALVAANVMSEANVMFESQEWLPFIALWTLCALSVAACLGIGLLIHEAQTRISQRRHSIESLSVRRAETIAEWATKFAPEGLNWLCSPQEHWELWNRDQLFAYLFAFVQIVATALAIWVMG